MSKRSNQFVQTLNNMRWDKLSTLKDTVILFINMGANADQAKVESLSPFPPLCTAMTLNNICGTLVF